MLIVFPCRRMAIKLKKAKEKKERKDMNRSKYSRTLMCIAGVSLFFPLHTQLRLRCFLIAKILVHG